MKRVTSEISNRGSEHIKIILFPYGDATEKFGFPLTNHSYGIITNSWEALKLWQDRQQFHH